MADTHDLENSGKQFTQVLNAAAKLPGVRIERAAYLRAALKRYCSEEQLDQSLRLLRVARFGSVLSAGVRGSRSAEKLLSNRVAWLLAVTAIVILAASQLLYLFADYPSYFDALYEAALATVTGSGFSADTVFARILHVVLAVFSVVVFATLAGTLGAYFLRREPVAEETSSPAPDESTPLTKNQHQ